MRGWQGQGEQAEIHRLRTGSCALHGLQKKEVSRCLVNTDITTEKHPKEKQLQASFPSAVRLFTYSWGRLKPTPSSPFPNAPSVKRTILGMLWDASVELHEASFNSGYTLKCTRPCSAQLSLAPPPSSTTVIFSYWVSVSSYQINRMKGR